MWSFQWRDTQWLPETQVLLQDRGMSYGDGLFETFRVSTTGQIPLFDLHQSRLSKGLSKLLFDDDANQVIQQAMMAVRPLLASLLSRNVDSTSLQNHSETVANNHGQLGLFDHGLIGKLVISRGVGPRGYDIPVNCQPTVLLQISPAPKWQSWLQSEVAEVAPRQGIHLHMADICLSHQPRLAGIKHCNRLEQVLARQERGEADDVLLLDSSGYLIEAGLANICLKIAGQWVTPDLAHCGVAGVIRQWLLDQNYSVVAQIHSSELASIEALMICNSVLGILAVESLDQYQFQLAPECAEWQTELESLYS